MKERLAWKVRRTTLDLSRAGMIMGILNVTSDSFSDGGSFLNPEAACEHALRMVGEGADIIDIGGESTRPGAEPVSLEEELERVIPPLRALRQRSDVLISVDTSKAAVADVAVREGADIINDITAMEGDPAMRDVARESGAGVVLMHMQGVPRTMQQAPHYLDAAREVGNFLRQKIDAALAWGLDPMSVAIDPGFGFGKTAEHNRQLLSAMPSLVSTGRPVLVGVSRKSFLGGTVEERFWPGVALTSYCREAGARVFRVHDCKPHREALRMTEAIVGDV